MISILTIDVKAQKKLSEEIEGIESLVSKFSTENVLVPADCDFGALFGIDADAADDVQESHSHAGDAVDGADHVQESYSQHDAEAECSDMYSDHMGEDAPEPVVYPKSQPVASKNKSSNDPFGDLYSDGTFNIRRRILTVAYIWFCCAR